MSFLIFQKQNIDRIIILPSTFIYELILIKISMNTNKIKKCSMTSKVIYGQKGHLEISKSSFSVIYFLFNA